MQIKFHSKFPKPLDFDIGMEALREQSQAEGEVRLLTTLLGFS